MQQANIITNKYEPQQKHRLGTVSKKYFQICVEVMIQTFESKQRKPSMVVKVLKSLERALEKLSFSKSYCNFRNDHWAHCLGIASIQNLQFYYVI